MARNRKLQSAAVRFGPALKALLLCALIGGSGVGYVWQKDQIIRLDRQIKLQENRLSALKEKNSSLRKQLSNMRSPGEIQRRIRELNLGLAEPQPAQKWRLIDPGSGAVPEVETPQRPLSPHIAKADRAER